MRVALDATPLSLSSGGLRRYTEQLSIALTSQFPEDEFVLISNQPFAAPTSVRASHLELKGLDRKWWLHGANRVARQIGAAVFHGTNFEVPYRRQRAAVATIHDLSPWKTDLPHNGVLWQRNAARARRRTRWLFRLGLVTIVITPTEAIRRELISFFRLPPDRVVAVHHGGLSPDAIPNSPQPRQGRPYFLFLGALEPRKNLNALIQAWRPLKSEADLILAGRRREDFPPIPDEPGLCQLGEIPDNDLPALFRNAAAFVYPSLYEGFGLPILEAMECGAMVITSRDPALTEVAGDAALRGDGPDELAERMRAALFNPDLAATQREKSLRRAKDFSWARAARETRAVYQEALARFK